MSGRQWKNGIQGPRAPELAVTSRGSAPHRAGVSRGKPYMASSLNSIAVARRLVWGSFPYESHPQIVFVSRAPPRPLEGQRPFGKMLCSSIVEAFVCLDFGSLASYWPRLWKDFGVPLGAARPPKGVLPGASNKQPRRLKMRPLSAFEGPGGLPRGAGSLQETTQATQNIPPAAEAHMFLVTSKHDTT